MKWSTLIPEGSQFNQLLCAFLISVPSFFYGNAIGWMSPMILLLQSNESPRDTPLTDLEVSWIASIPYLVSIPGTYLMNAIGDRYGRKIAVLVLSGVTFANWLLKLCSMSTWAFIGGSSLVGIITSGCYVTCPAYIKEISENNIRGALGCWITICFTSGTLFSFIIGDVCSYRVVLIILMIIPAVHIAIFLMMPESPSYLIRKGKDEEASKSLIWLRCKNEYDLTIKDEIDYIKEEQKNDEGQESFLLKKILSDRILRRAFYISLVFGLSRELCGLSQITIFAGEIFQITAERGRVIELSPNENAMVVGAMQLGGVILASSIIERSGRRPLAIVMCLISASSMCVVASWFLLQHFNPPAWIPLFTLCVCIFCETCGILSLSPILTGETFSYKYRGTVLATTSAISSMTNFVLLLFFKPLVNVVGIYSTFYFFGAICLLTALSVITMVPETRDRKLEDIYYDLRTKNEKRELENRNQI